MPESKRTFVGVPLDDAVRAAAMRAASGLRRSLGDDRAVKWERRDNLHVTLHFLGNTDVARLGDVESALAEAAAAHAPFHLSLGPPVWFPGRGKPRVFVTKVRDGARELIDLQPAVAAGLDPLGFPADKRDYRPHVTVGRVRRNRKISAGRANEACEHAAASVEPLRMFVTEIVLFESTLSPEGATYSRLATLPLG
jgi:2'-5' RNA ligase